MSLFIYAVSSLLNGFKPRMEISISYSCFSLSHWGRATHICVNKLTIIGSDNGLSPGRRQAIIRTNAGILLIGPIGTNFSEILIKIHTFSFKKMNLKMSSGKCRPSCLGLNVLRFNYSVDVLISISSRTDLQIITRSIETFGIITVWNVFNGGTLYASNTSGDTMKIASESITINFTKPGQWLVTTSGRPLPHSQCVFFHSMPPLSFSTTVF